MSDKVTHISQLNFDQRNPRKHNPRNIGVVVDSLQKVGAARSIVIDENNQILAGNGVTEAATLAGIEKVVEVEADGNTLIAVRRRDLTDEQKQALKYYDNRSGELAEWSADVILADFEAGAVDFSQLWSEAEWSALLEGFGSELLGRNGAGGDAAPQVDRAAELQAVWGTQVGQVWQLGEHRLAIGDCTDKATVEAVMRGERAQAVVTDPPYSSGGFTRGDRTLGTDKKYIQTGTKDKKRNFSGDNRDQRSWIRWCERWLALYLSFSESGSPLAVWTDWRQLPATTDAIQGGGWVWRGIAVWDKTEAARPLYGRFRPQAEYLVWGSSGNFPLNDGRPSYRGVFTKPVDSDKIHQTQKPVEVVEWSLSMTKEGDIVLDPFLGSGTTLVACENLTRRCRAIEIDPGYAAVSLQRWADATGRQPERVSG